MPMGGSAAGVPAGTVAHFGASTAPAGWLNANGAAVSRTAYAALFLAIGTTYGAGDGATTFNLPDLRGEFLRGLDDGRGVDAGRVIGSAQGDALQGHFHDFSTRINATGFGQNSYSASTSATGTEQTQANGVRAPVTDGVNGTPRTAIETRPRNVAVLACIKY